MCKQRWIRGLTGGLIALLAAKPVWAHDGAIYTERWWAAWNSDPIIVGGLALFAWFYGRGVYRLWQQAGTGRGVARWQTAAFAAGWLALAVALLSPLDYLSHWLFAAHMGQHLLLLVVAPPLVVLGAPPLVWAWATPRRWRRPLARWWHRQSGLRRWAKRISHPYVAWGSYGLMVWLWHIPILYETAVHNPWVHALEHACFAGAALFFWGTVARPGRNASRYALGLLFVFTTALHNTLLGVLITFAPTPWYAVYTERAEQWGLTPLADQQLAGVIMWVPAGLAYLLAVLLLLYVWLTLLEQRDNARLVHH